MALRHQMPEACAHAEACASEGRANLFTWLWGCWATEFSVPSPGSWQDHLPHDLQFYISAEWQDAWTPCQPMDRVLKVICM